MKKVTIFSVILLLCVPVMAGAATLSVKSDVVIPDTETVEDNLYAVGGAVRIFSQSKGDVVSVHGDGVLSGEIDGDVLVVGVSTNLNGIIHGDVRIVGKRVVIDAQVKGDVVIIAGDVLFGPSSRITGEVITVAEKMTLAGATEDVITAITNSIEVSGVISGLLKSTTNHFLIKETAQIVDSITYRSPSQAVIENGADIAGSIEYNEVQGLRDQAVVERVIVNFLSLWRVLQFITTLLLVFIFVHMFKVFSTEVTRFVLSNYFRAFTVGFISLIVIPIIAFLFFISIFALPIAIIITSLYVVGIMISTAVASIYLGVFFQKVTGKGGHNEIRFKSAAVAVLILTLLQFIPFVGDVIRIVVAIAAFGGIIRTVYRSVRHGTKRVKV